MFSFFSSSLRRQLFLAFALIVILTVLLSGLLSSWNTSSQFNILVTEQGEQRASEIAPLLEASFAYHGSWERASAMLQTPLDVGSWASTIRTLPDELASYNLDWNELVAGEVGVAVSDLFPELPSEAVIVDGGVSERLTAVQPDELVRIIVDAEQQFVDMAVANQDVTPEDADAYLGLTISAAESFVYSLFIPQGSTDFPDIADQEFVDWDQVLQQELSLSADEYWDLRSRLPLSAIAVQQNVDLSVLEQALIKEEVDLLNRHSASISESEYIQVMADIVFWARAYINSDDGFGNNLFYEALPVGASLLSSYLLGDEQLFVMDADGLILYDSVSAREGDRLSVEMLEQSVALVNLETGAQIGYVLVAAGDGFYDTQQQTFLESMTVSLLISGAVSGVLGLMMAAVFSRQITNPVVALTEAAQEMAAGKSGQLLTVTSQNELATMSDSFNRMSQALTTQKDLRQRMVRDISHELNTPLSVIQLELETLQHGMQTSDTAYMHVQREIGLLHRLIDDLTQLTDADQAQLSLDVMLVDLVPLTQQAASRFNAQALTQKVALAVPHSYHELPLAEVDVGRLQQVVANLVNNALHHTPQDGRITIKCEFKSVRQFDILDVYRPANLDPDQLWLITTVADSGCGISDKDLPFLFERFYRADESRNRNSGGRGLGLSIVKQIIEAHGGFVWAGLNGTQGSVFGYALPPAKDVC